VEEHHSLYRADYWPFHPFEWCTESPLHIPDYCAILWD